MNSGGSIVLTSILLISTITVALGQSVDTTSTEDTSKTITIEVRGITCGNDLVIINDNVKMQTGVLKSEAVGKPSAQSTFKITYNPVKITRSQIIKVVEASPSCDHPELKPYRVKQE